MSFAEVLAAARELTADEQRELARELAEPVGESDDEQLRRLLPPEGFVAEMNWPIEASEQNIAALQRALAEADAQP